MSYDEWIGKSKDQNDSMAPEQLQRYEAMLDRDPGSVTAGTELPPCSHWIYFTGTEKHSELTENGYPKPGIFLPNIELPRRMWAGGSIQFKKPLKTGSPADKKSTIIKIDEKEGASGKLCFVTIRHQISSYGNVAIDEEQQLVFRESSEEGAHPVRTKPIDIDYDWKKTRKPDSIQLFQFSALTFNSHRIHYDYPYATREEGYPNLPVHAPFLLMLMMDSFKNKTDGKVIEDIQYRAEGPMYLGEEITITCKNVDNAKAEMRAVGPDNKIALSATIKWVYSWNR
jgi:3-methylfumaryl-CoA hydratase